MKKLLIIFVILIGAIFLSSLQGYTENVVPTEGLLYGLPKVIRVYDPDGTLKQIITENFAWDIHNSKKSDKPWPEWDTGKCPKYPSLDMNYAVHRCLTCHNQDRTLRGRVQD